MAKPKPQKHELDILISPSGDKVEVHVQGVKGKQCVPAAQFLEDGLGVVEERSYTREYRQQPDKKVVNVGFNRT